MQYPLGRDAEVRYGGREDARIRLRRADFRRAEHGVEVLEQTELRAEMAESVRPVRDDHERISRRAQRVERFPNVGEHGEAFGPEPLPQRRRVPFGLVRTA